MAALTLGIGSAGVAQEAGDENSPLVKSKAAVEAEAERISDWALAGVVWSDAHLVRKLASRGQSVSESAERTEELTALVEDCDRIIDVMKRFGWQRLEARRAETPTAAETPTSERSIANLQTTGESAAVPAGSLPRRVETETPPGLNDPGVDDELLPDDFDFSLRRYRVDDYIDEVAAEERSRADAIEDGVEGALAAGIDNVSGQFGTGAADGRLSQREMMTRSNTLPYSKDSIYDTDDFDPNVDYDVDQPLNEPVPSDSNELIENVPDADLESPPVDRDDPSSVPAQVPDVDSEDDVVQALANNPDEVEITVDSTRPPEQKSPTAASSEIAQFTERSGDFAQDAAWVQFQLDANERMWQMLPADPSEEALRPYLRAAVAQLQSHAQEGGQLSDNQRLAAILQAIGDNQ